MPSGQPDHTPTRGPVSQHVPRYLLPRPRSTNKHPPRTYSAASIMADTTCWVAPRHIATTQRLRGYQSNNASLVSECWSFRMLHLDSQFALYFAIFQVAGLSYGSFHSVGLRAARRVPLRRTAAAVVSRPDRRCSPHCVIGLGIPHCRPSPPNFSQLTLFRISKTVDELPAASTSSQLVIPLSTQPV